MTVFARTAFFVCLGIVLALPERESVAAGGICVANVAVQFEHAPHPVTFGARAILPDGCGHRLATAPHGTADSVCQAPCGDVGDAAEHPGFHVVVRAAVLLPPARAPPLFS
jgi:hypothetical protein